MREFNVRSDDIISHITEIESCLGVSGARSGDDLAKQRRHCYATYVPTR